MNNKLTEQIDAFLEKKYNELPHGAEIVSTSGYSVQAIQDDRFGKLDKKAFNNLKKDLEKEDNKSIVLKTINEPRELTFGDNKQLRMEVIFYPNIKPANKSLTAINNTFTKNGFSAPSYKKVKLIKAK